MPDPTVSVVMSVYRDRGELVRTIESVLTQSYSDLEFIVVDDASPDDVWPRLLELGKREKRLRCVRNASNEGLTRSLNRGLGIARGEYIARVDEGDVWLPGKLERQVEFLRENDGHVLIGTRSSDCDGAHGVRSRGPRLPIQDREIRKWLFSGLTPITHSAIVFRDGLVRYHQKARTSQDYDLCLRLSLTGKLHNLPDVLVRRNTSSDSITASKQEMQFFDHLLMHRHFMDVLRGRVSRDEFVRCGANMDARLLLADARKYYMRHCSSMLNRHVSGRTLRRVLSNLLIPDLLLYQLRKRSAPYLMRRVYSSWVTDA